MSHFSMPHPYSPGPLTGNDWLIWSLAIGLSLSLHVMFFLHRQPLIDRPANIIQETITHLRFAQIAPTPVQEPEPQMPKAEPQPIEPPKPVVKQQPQSQLKTKAVAEAKPVAPKKPTKHTPVKKLKPKEVKPATRVKPLNQQQPVAVQQAAVAPVNHTEQIVQGMPLATDPDKLLLEQTRKSYQAQLMRHIELHKHYPRVARRRNIQGKVLVSFTVHADGSITGLSLSGKHSILKKATQQAINNALPMPKPPQSLTWPKTIEFAMNYSLN